jgi:hypothetical protein
MVRRRYRTIHVAQLDRQMAEAEAIRRAVEAGARWAWVRGAERIVDGNETPVWEIVVGVIPTRRRRE